MLRLRGHHLICLQFFVGKGYSPKFVKNTLRVLKNVRGWIVIVDGIDDVCSACPYRINDRCANPRTSERIRDLDRLSLSLLSVRVGSRICWNEIKQKLPKILPIWIKKACKSCRWWKICKNEILKFKC